MVMGTICRREFLKLIGTTFASLKISDNLSVKLESITTDKPIEDLSESARSFIAQSHAEAVWVAEILKGKGADPSNICGPLSTAIMSDWRISSDGKITIGNHGRLSGVNPAEMWLATLLPGHESSNPQLFEEVFPSERYKKYRIFENISKVDFDNIPEADKLQPGDFIYLVGGSFTHFVTVSRKGKYGELYATSNIPSNIKGEFIIDEVMLWNPISKAGYLRDWAAGVGPERAYTGRGGFYLWRKYGEKEKILSDIVSQKYRNLFLNILRNQNKGRWNVSIVELSEGKFFEWREARCYHPISTIKVPIAVALLQTLKETYFEEILNDGLNIVLTDHGISGRTFDQLITAMTVYSEEPATECCVNYINRVKPINKKFEELNLTNTTYSPRQSNQRDLCKCWEGLVLGKYLDKEMTQYLLDKLSTTTENDKMLTGVINNFFPQAIQKNKRGIVMEDGLYTMQDSGVIEIDGKIFYVGISGTSITGRVANDLEMRNFIEFLCKTFSRYLKERIYTEGNCTFRSN